MSLKGNHRLHNEFWPPPEGNRADSWILLLENPITNLDLKGGYRGRALPRTLFPPGCLQWAVRSNFHTREFDSREHYRFFGHTSEPCGN